MKWRGIIYLYFYYLGEHERFFYLLLKQKKQEWNGVVYDMKKRMGIK
jgi:hypothetical protein